MIYVSAATAPPRVGAASQPVTAIASFLGLWLWLLLRLLLLDPAVVTTGADASPAVSPAPASVAFLALGSAIELVDIALSSYLDSRYAGFYTCCERCGRPSCHFFGSEAICVCARYGAI